MSAIVECKNIVFSYNPGGEKQEILRKISLKISQGKLLALLGPNGVGKSTLLNCLCGLNKPQAGEILLGGQDIFKLSRQQIAKRIAYVPQKISVPFDYSVRDFVVMGRTAHLSMLQQPGIKDYEKVESSLEKLGVHHLLHRRINTLSGGEQQKVCIARALVQEPDLIVLDEPTSALDYGNQIHVLRLVKELSLSGFSVLITTHNPDQCLLLQSEVAILDVSGTLRIGGYDTLITGDLLSNLYGVQIKIVFSREFNRKICLPIGL